MNPARELKKIALDIEAAMKRAEGVSCNTVTLNSIDDFQDALRALQPYEKQLQAIAEEEEYDVSGGSPESKADYVNKKLNIMLGGNRIGDIWGAAIRMNSYIENDISEHYDDYVTEGYITNALSQIEDSEGAVEDTIVQIIHD